MKIGQTSKSKMDHERKKPRVLVSGSVKKKKKPLAVWQKEKKNISRGSFSMYYFCSAFDYRALSLSLSLTLWKVCACRHPLHSRTTTSVTVRHSVTLLTGDLGLCGARLNFRQNFDLRTSGFLFFFAFFLFLLKYDRHDT